MGDARFESLQKVLGEGTSRRSTLSLLGGLGLAMLPGVSGARSKHKSPGKRNHKHKSETHHKRKRQNRKQNARVSAQGKPGTTGQGQYQTLAAKWWAWVIDEDLAPPLESGAVNCAAGQQGTTWFLAGTDFTLPPVERRCTVPAGTKLFFPVVNNFYGEPPAFYTPHTAPGGIDPDNTQLQVLRAVAAQQIDAYTPADLTATVDGVAVPVVRAQSAIFPLILEEDNPFDSDEFDVPGGTYPSASDGYWVLLGPLPPGEHTIHFAAPVRTIGSEDLDVTYVITVA